MIGSELLRFDRKRKYLVYDVETTGLNLGFSLPFQISYAVFTMDRILEEHNFFIAWDDLRMSEGAARITRFNPDEYQRQAIDGEAVLKSFDAYLYDPDIFPIGQNVLGYDSMIHAVWRRRLGVPIDYSYLDRSFDTVALSKAYKKGIKPDIQDFIPWQYRMLGIVERGLKTSLSTMGKELEVPFNPDLLHDSREDIRLNIGIFRKLLFKLEI